MESAHSGFMSIIATNVGVKAIASFLYSVSRPPISRGFDAIVLR